MDTVNTRYPQIRIHQRAALELRLYRQAQEQAGTPISMTRFASEAILKALGFDDQPLPQGGGQASASARGEGER